jgi:hypothetical protein
MTDRVRFLTNQGKEILLIDLSNNSPDDLGKTFRTIPDFVSHRPPGSVLILSDFTGAAFDGEAIRIMQQTAVFDKPFVKRSAFVGTEKFPQGFLENLSSFSRREFFTFMTREKAMAWLVKG